MLGFVLRRRHSARVVRVVALLAALGVAAGLAVVAMQAQAQGQATPYRAPRAADGHPDLNGIWQALNEANFDIEPHSARAAMALRPGPYVPVPAAPVLALGAVGSVPGGPGVVQGGSIPYKPEALKQKLENQQHWLERDPEIKCYLPGLPRATYMPYPFQIFQSQSAVFMAYTYAGAARNIYLKDPGPPEVDSWMGQSVGRWDGETFVIESTGFIGSAWLDRSGNFTTSRLKVTERFTRTGPDHLLYEATLDDPDIYTRPWTISMPLYRRMEPDARLVEFKCVEFVEELMYGEWRKNPLPR